MNLDLEIAKRTEAVDKALRQFLPDQCPDVLQDAMAYSLFAGGKRLRPLLAIGSCEAAGGNWEEFLPFACGIEMIHAYSLIHDDLPSMDNADLRRGKPSNHKVFGEGMALLAGDGLLNLAYEVMAGFCCQYPFVKNMEAMKIIGSAAGANGMIGGQSADILFENKICCESELIYIQENKTGKLIAAAFLSGAVFAGAENGDLDKLKMAGEKLGRAFQIADDILDVTADQDALGKPVKSDVKNNKNTAVTVYGLEKAEEIYGRLSKEAEEILETFQKGSFLFGLCQRLANRSK